MTRALLLLAASTTLVACGTTESGRSERASTAYAPNTVTQSEAQRDVARVEEMLRGQIAGVQVTQGPNGLSIRIRGNGTAGLSQSSDEPLFVIDGLPIRTTGGALVGINPRDIESITVLKNASDTALYGSRGANGVILITTRRPPEPSEG